MGTPPPTASNFAIVSRSEPFAFLFPLLLRSEVETEGSGEEEAALRFGEVERERFCWFSRLKAAMRSWRVGSFDPVVFADLHVEKEMK